MQTKIQHRQIWGYWALLFTIVLGFSPAMVQAKSLPTQQVINQPLLAQEASSTAVKITGITVKPTATGVGVVLATPTGKITAPNSKTQGNILYFDLPNATLSLADGKDFRVENPATGIANVSVTQVNASYVRVLVTGVSSVPSATLVFTDATSVPVAQTPAEPELEITVIGGRKRSRYSVPNASTATKTDTPLRDVPGSIQVIPKEVIKDQGVTKISDALRNVSGVTAQRDFSDDTDTRFNIRGFSNESATLRNGFRVGPVEIAPSNIERIEVLKGPASVLYGQFEPGGVVNFVTKQPLSEPFYSASFTAGSFGFYEPSIDLSGSLTSDKKLLYRLTGAYQKSGSFRDFVRGEKFSIAPTLSYQFSDATKLTVGYEFLSSNRTFDDGLPIDPVTSRLPINRFLGEPNDFVRSTTHNLNATVDHKFNENISLKTALGSTSKRNNSAAFRLFEFDPATNQIDRFYSIAASPIADTLSWQTDLSFKFDTGSVKHQFLVGVELARSQNTSEGSDTVTGLFLDVDNPVYGTPITPPINFFSSNSISNTVGVYIQDQIALLPNLKLLLGGRYDFSNTKSDVFGSFQPDPPVTTSDNFNNQAFSPRIGLVYQPIQPVSLYASYSQSFVPNNAATSTGAIIEPTRGTQFEAGIKADLGNKLTATLAAYQITKTNILTTDPADPNFSIPVGEAKSQGLELDVRAEILPGWNVIASTFLNDTRISKDNDLPVGNTLINAPKSGASLWTTYQLQTGDLKGLGFGAGLFYTGDREAQLPNDFVLPAYLSADASIFYKRDDWRVGLNFKNLFNTRYFESAQNSGLIYPGAPFSVQGTVSVEF